MVKKVKWVNGRIEDLPKEVKTNLEDIGSILVQVGDKVKVFYPEHKDDEIDDILKPTISAKKLDGDIGSGKPGSMRWHESHIKHLNIVQAKEYVKKVTGKSIELKGRIDYARKNALKAIEDYYGNR